MSQGTCGTCKWGRVQGADLTKRVCFGGPPTPVLLGAAPQANGQVAMRLELVRPVVDSKDPQCSRYEGVIMVGAKG